MKQFFILLAAIAFGLLCSCEQTPVKVDVESVTLNKTAVVLDKGGHCRACGYGASRKCHQQDGPLDERGRGRGYRFQ